MNTRTEETLAIIAALIVLFSAMWDSLRDFMLPFFSTTLKFEVENQ